MNSDKDDLSPFSRLRKSGAPGCAPPPPAPDARVQVLEAAFRELKGEFDAYRAGTATPAPVQAAPQLLARLERAEAGIAALREELGAAGERAGTAATKAEVSGLDQRTAGLEAAVAGLQRAVAGERELAAKLERSGAELAEVKIALTVLEEVKRGGAQYAEEFSRIEHECRKALGEMQGYIRSAQEKPLAGRFDEHLKEAVGRLNVKLSEVEIALHAGLSRLSSRLDADRALSEKIFTEVEDRVRKGVEPGLKAAADETKWLRDKVLWLKDEYKIVMERKIRALEGKYSAFEAISDRMDTICESLEKNDK